MDRLIRTLILALASELIDQGHKNTGSLINSLEGRIQDDPNGFDVSIWANKYAHYLDKGVKANRIPYSGRSGGGRSQYIQALIAYFRQKGAADPKAAAFATANKHKKEGMPTRRSYRFSSTGKRKGFIKEALNKRETIINKRLTDLASKKLDKKVDKIFNQIEFHGGGTGVGGGGIWIF